MGDTPVPPFEQSDNAHPGEDGTLTFAPYRSAAGGWGALRATAQALREPSVVLKGPKALLSMNQPDCARQ